MEISDLTIPLNTQFKLSDIATNDTGGLNSKKEAKQHLSANVEKLFDLQSKLYAKDKYGILIIFQAMDTAGKDSAIKHVMTGLNPQGTQVSSFKKPSVEEMDHDYLWRASKQLPERGNIGIFNRSYYEEVLVVRVHDLLKSQRIPLKLVNDDIWQMRYRQINDFEKYLHENGIIPIKFFLHISKDEQKRRLLSRINDKSKNWKFSQADIEERGYWDDYQKCFQESIAATNTTYAPWHIIPADIKWYARLAISEVIVNVLEKLELSFPTLTDEQYQELERCKQQLTNEEELHSKS